MPAKWVTAEEFEQKMKQWAEAARKVSEAREKLAPPYELGIDPAPAPTERGAAVRVDQDAWDKLDKDIDAFGKDEQAVSQAVQKQQPAPAPGPATPGAPPAVPGAPRR
jgi:hypothetical protein